MLRVEDLTVSYAPTAGAPLQAVRGMDLTVRTGETLGLVGESGCGKTTFTRAVLGLLPSAASASGSVTLRHRELLGLDEEAARRVRGKEIALIPQGAMSALNPVLTVGSQVVEPMTVHLGLGRREAWNRAGDLFERVGLDPDRRGHYPHEFSGGMRQRVVIAMALAAGADLLIADEPTTGLDVLVQGQILRLLAELKADLGLTLLLVSHDLRVVLRTCDRVAVMYAGKIVEEQAATALKAAPRHPYSAGLLRALPHVDADAGAWRSVPGNPPDLREPPAGCAFHPRCPHAFDPCDGLIPAAQTRSSGRVACHLWDDPARTVLPEVTGRDEAPAITPSADRTPASDMLHVRGLSKTFHRGGFWRRTAPVQAVRDVDIGVGRGEIVGLIGQSGSGKTTIARALLRLVEPSGGRILLDGTDVRCLKGRSLRRYRQRVGMIRQDPYDSLHPGMKVAALVAEPLRVAARAGGSAANPAAVETRVGAALQDSGLPPTDDLLGRYPFQLSGGQRQGVALARALVGEPELLLADEPTSMLDVSVRAGIIATLARLRDGRGLGILLVTHDLAEAFHLCDRIIVLRNGRIVETGAAAEVALRPRHPYTRALVVAAEDPLTGGMEPIDADADALSTGEGSGETSETVRPGRKGR